VRQYSLHGLLEDGFALAARLFHRCRDLRRKIDQLEVEQGYSHLDPGSHACAIGIVQIVIGEKMPGLQKQHSLQGIELGGLRGAMARGCGRAAPRASPKYSRVRSLATMLFLETRHFLADHNLNYTDRAGMAAGVGGASTLVDLELIDFAAKIPASMKQTGREGKSIFKEAMQGILPHDVVYRPRVDSAHRFGVGCARSCVRKWRTRWIRRF